MAYGGSRARAARGLIEATAASLYQSHSNASRICDLLHRSWQCRILNPLSEARHRTHNLMVPSWICFSCATAGTLRAAQILIYGTLNDYFPILIMIL